MSDQAKILWINPVSYDGYDQPMADFMKTIKRDDTALDIVSLKLPFTLTNVEYRTYEALTLGEIIRITRDAAEKKYDAIVNGCFYDFGLEDCREISGEAVVVAPCQASVQIAANISGRFSVIVGRHKWIEQMTERVRAYGYDHNLASMRPINMGVNQLQEEYETTVSRILEEGQRAIDEDGAEALILGCTCNFGFYKEVQAELGVPVIDPICAALKMAETMAHMKQTFDWKPSRVGGWAPPPEDEIAAFGLFNTKPQISKIISA